MNSSIAATYQKRAEDFKQLSNEITAKDSRLSLFRTVFFVAAVVAFVYFANAREATMVWVILLLLAVCFPLLIRYHNKIKAEKTRLLNLHQINRDEIKRLGNQLKSFDKGEVYKDPLHPYSSDLDVFGEHSLFQLLNRSTTRRGKDKLAHWLQHPAEREEVMQRQASVKELLQDLDWNQNFQAHGMASVSKDPKKEEDTETLLNWVKEPPSLLRKNTYLALSRIMPMVAVVAILAYFWYDVSALFPVLVLVINGAVLWSVADKAASTHAKTSKGVGVLKAYLGMIQMVESKEFQANGNREARQQLQSTKVAASAEIKKLQNILDNFDARGNMFYHILNVVLLLDIYWLLKAELWKKHTQADVALWFDTVNYFEAIVSLTGFAHANPSYIFPEIAAEPYVFNARQLGHCLIDRQKMVPNDFAMQGKGNITIITGSNMSGKSTFLRTIGVNIVLALTGAPVCAEKLTVSKLQVFTSMRTQDNLEESVSSFYAELKRLRQLLDGLKAPETPVMFMLDEILKGTNSQDRHHGAASLVKQLSQLEATGFVSTHDLELGKLEETLPNVKNYSFISTIENDEIYFDYKVHEGICKSFNASKLMAKMGIAIER